MPRLPDSRLSLVFQEGGVVLTGRTHSYHSKQLAQQAVMEASDLPIIANDIEVS